MVNKFLLTALVLIFSSVLQAQQKIATDDLIARCSEKLIPYAERDKIPKNPVRLLDLVSSSKGRLYFFGAGHSSDPSDPQFLKIEQAWNQVKPTIAFYEGPNRPIAATRDETIKQAGESGFVRFLATRDGIPFVTLEPSPQEEANFVMQKFSREQVMLFYVLREAQRLRERRKMSGQEIRVAITQLLERVAKAKVFENPFANLNELEAAYKRYWKSPEHWWQAPSAWFDPLNSSSKTGGIFTNEINQMSSGYRNLHMYRILSKAVLDEKKVFAVVGGDHIPMQADALRCAVK